MDHRVKPGGDEGNETLAKPQPKMKTAAARAAVTSAVSALGQ
jgi:hypothetical protein